MEGFKQVVSAHVRLAERGDAPRVLSLIQQLAEFERLSEMCVATVEKLESSLFNTHNQAPFQGPTVLLLEVSSDSSSTPSLPPKADTDAPPLFQEEAHTVTPRTAIKDPQAHAFVSSHGEGRVVAGFVLFFPNYSTFLAKPGFYIEDLFVRECFRGCGFGTILLQTVARLAVRLGYGRVEWCVLDWNENAIKFYQGIGADVLPEWRICRLTGQALQIQGSEDKKTMPKNNP